MSETFHEESTLEEQFIILADGIVAFYDNLEAIQDYTTRTFDNPNDAAENFIALYKELGHKADVITKASNAIRSYCKEEISLAMVEVGVDGSRPMQARQPSANHPCEGQSRRRGNSIAISLTTIYASCQRKGRIWDRWAKL